jgi:hypothetical protein
MVGLRELVGDLGSVEQKVSFKRSVDFDFKMNKVYIYYRIWGSDLWPHVFGFF